jgi:tryptophan synthase alpha chain
MNRIDKAFEKLHPRERALIGYMTLGFLKRRRTIDLCLALLEECDLLELGIPFSDPIMDGPVIQRSSATALRRGFRLADAFRLAEELRGRTEKPLLFMTYYNPVFRLGHREFARRAAGAGVDGVIIPDLPPEEMGPWREAADAEGLYTIFFLSPTSPEERMEMVGREARGFVYCISLKGVTGARRDLPEGLWDFLERTRRHCPLPRALGLGISRPEQCREVAPHVEAVVVGSAFVGTVLDALDRGEDPLPALVGLARSLKEALSSSR